VFGIIVIPDEYIFVNMFLIVKTCAVAHGPRALLLRTFSNEKKKITEARHMQLAIG
jgi:hypothetical protein